MVFGTGSRRIWEAVNLFGSPENAYFSLLSEGECLNLTDIEIKNIRNTDQKNASDHIENCRKMGIEIVGYDDPLYPDQLRHIYNPPTVLYYKGNIHCLSGTRTVSVVGTRRPSDYGLDAAYNICRELALAGCVIVSGFAIGTDITSHMAAADNHRPTACVMGCGLNINYPKDNFAFRDRIIENGGVFVSEYPPGTAPLPGNFPKRNRILAALGRAAVIFEASLKSGSLITADLAAACGRDIFVLPPADIFSSAFGGNIELLKNGAFALYSARDVIECFRIGSVVDLEIRTEKYEGISTFAVNSSIERRYESSIDRIKKTAKKAPKKRSANSKSGKKDTAASETDSIKNEAADNTINNDKPDIAETTVKFTDLQRRIIQELSDGAIHADVLAEKVDLDMSELMTELTELELIGALRSLPGKMFEIYK